MSDSKNNAQVSDEISVGLSIGDTQLIHQLINIGVKELGVDGVIPCAILMEKIQAAVGVKNEAASAGGVKS